MRGHVAPHPSTIGARLASTLLRKRGLNASGDKRITQLLEKEKLSARLSGFLLQAGMKINHSRFQVWSSLFAII